MNNKTINQEYWCSGGGDSCSEATAAKVQCAALLAPAAATQAGDLTQSLSPAKAAPSHGQLQEVSSQLTNESL